MGVCARAVPVAGGREAEASANSSGWGSRQSRPPVPVAAPGQERSGPAMATRFCREKAQKQNEQHQAILAKLLREEDNKYCADCEAKGTRGGGPGPGAARPRRVPARGGCGPARGRATSAGRRDRREAPPDSGPGGDSGAGLGADRQPDLSVWAAPPWAGLQPPCPPARSPQPGFMQWLAQPFPEVSQPRPLLRCQVSIWSGLWPSGRDWPMSG